MDVDDQKRYYMRAYGDVSRDRYPEATHRIGENEQVQAGSSRKRILNGHNFDARKGLNRNAGRVLCTEARAGQELRAESNEG